MLATTRKFAEKLSAAFALTVLLMVLVGLTAFLSLRALGDGGHSEADAHATAALDAERLRAWVNREVNASYRAMTERTPDALAESDAAHSAFVQRLTELRGRVGDARGQQTLAVIDRGERDLQLALERQAIAPPPVNPALLTDVRSRQDSLERMVDEFVSYEQRQAELTRQGAQASLARGQRFVLLGAAAAILLTAGLALLLIRRLTRSFADAQNAIQTRERFLSYASEELRRPLSSLTHQLEPLRRSPEWAARLEGANQQVSRLNTLVNELLEASQLSTGKLQLNREPVDLSVLVREVEARFEPQLARSGSAVAVHANRPAMGVWDRARLEEVITHLLSNALAHSHGRVVRISVEPGEPTRLVVRDHGTGMSREMLAHVFEAYEGGVVQHHAGNLGLGLYIVRRIVEAHGGNVRVDSTLDLGSTFVVELPRRPITAPVERRGFISRQPSHAQ